MGFCGSCKCIQDNPVQGLRGNEDTDRLRFLRYRSTSLIQGYLAGKKTPTSLGTSWDPRHRPTVGSYRVAVSCQSHYLRYKKNKRKGLRPRTYPERTRSKMGRERARWSSWLRRWCHDQGVLWWCHSHRRVLPDGPFFGENSTECALWRAGSNAAISPWNHPQEAERRLTSRASPSDPLSKSGLDIRIRK